MEQQPMDKTQWLIEEGMFEEALEYSEPLLARDPENVSLLRQRAHAFLSLDQWDAGLECYDRALKTTPQDPELIAEKADFLASAGKLEDALLTYEAALKYRPESNEFLQRKADALARLGRFSESTACYDELLRRDPDNELFWSGKGDSLIGEGLFQDGMTCLRRASELAEKKNSPWTGYDWSARGDTVRTMGHFADALTFYDRALALEPDNPWALRGAALALQADPNSREAALDYMERSLKSDPKSFVFLMEKGNILFDLKRYLEADDCYARASEVDPNSFNAVMNRSAAQERLGDYPRSLFFAELAIRINNQSADAWVQKGLCLDRVGKLELAIEAYDEALKIDPNAFWALNNKGYALDATGHPDLSLEWFDKAIALDEGESIPWTNKARALNRLERSAEALSLLMKAMEVVRDTRDVLETFGLTYSEYLYDDETALQYYERRLQLDPDDITTKANIAECLIKLHRHAEARAAAQELAGKEDDQVLRGVMLIIVMIASSLEGDTQSGRRAFAELLACLSLSQKAESNYRDWNFRGLIREIKLSDISTEAKFVLLTVIDLLSRALPASELTFFKPLPERAAAAAAVSA